MAQQNETQGGGSSGTERAKEKAREMKDKAETVTESATAEARDRGREAMEEGKEKARELRQEATRKARSRADEQKDRLAEGIHSMADALRSGSRELPEDRQQYGRVLETVADRVEDVSGYLAGHDVDGMARDAKRFARDHTALFLGGAFTLGLAGARFLKSSGGRAAESRYEGQGLDQGGYGARPELGHEGSVDTGAMREPRRREGGSMEGGGATRPYPRSSTTGDAVERIKEEGGYA